GRLSYRPVCSGENFVVSLRSWPCGGCESVADLDSFHGLNAHQGLREPRVELAVVLNVGAQSRRNAEGEHLENSPDGVTFPLNAIDLADHFLGGLFVEATHLGGVYGIEIVYARQCATRG